MGYEMRIIDILAGIVIGAFIMWIVMQNIDKEPINVDEIKKEYERDKQRYVDSVKNHYSKLPVDSSINYVMRPD